MLAEFKDLSATSEDRGPYFFLCYRKQVQAMVEETKENHSETIQK